MKQALFKSLVDAVRNGKRVELGFTKKGWMQAVNDIKTAAHYSNVIILEKNQKQTLIS